MYLRSLEAIDSLTSLYWSVDIIQQLSLDFFKMSVVVCSCNLVTLETKFRNGVGSKPVVGNTPSRSRWIL